MTLRLVSDPDLTDELRADLIALWTDTANAGGAIGFVGVVTRAEVAELAQRGFAGVTDGPDRLLVGYVDYRPVAMLFFVSRRFALSEHWRTVKRVMVHPAMQGHGYGSALMHEAERVARQAGWSGLHLTVRAGLHTERFYVGLGYKEVGRLPGALRVAPGDDRDEIHMWLPLSAEHGRPER